MNGSEPTLCRVARKAEKGETRGQCLIPQRQLVNRKWTRHTPQFPAIFASGHKGFIFTQREPFLAKWTNRSLLVFGDLCGDQRGEGCTYFRGRRMPAAMGNLADFLQNSTTSFAESGSEKIAKIHIYRRLWMIQRGPI